MSPELGAIIEKWGSYGVIIIGLVWYIKFLHKSYGARLDKRDASLKELTNEIKKGYETHSQDTKEFKGVLESLKSLLEMNFKK